MNFAENKTHYNKGQIFPFLIAIICVILIMIMITVNLGRISIFKTDTSNAADSAALAAASVLSGSLLSLGLKSESMSGRSVEVILALIVELLLMYVTWGLSIIFAIFTYVAFLIEQITNLMTAQGEGRLAWSNAKKTALQYAFQNAGVDERRPTFKEFLKAEYGIANPDSLPAEYIRAKHDIYLHGDSTVSVRTHTETGFARFMRDKERGYWNEGVFGEIDPGNTTPGKLVSGYGWGDDLYQNSYDDTSKTYKAFNNWVEVQVISASLYGIDFYSWLAQGPLFDCTSGALFGAITIPWWLEWLADPTAWIKDIVLFWLVADGIKYMFPTGLDFMGDDPEEGAEAQTTNNYIMVKVIRHREPHNLGLWNFFYGDTYSFANSHAFQEHHGTSDYETIHPVFLDNLLTFGCSGGSGSTSRHLFETELTDAF